MTSKRGLLGNLTTSVPVVDAVVAPVVSSVPVGDVASTGAILEPVTSTVTGSVATTGALLGSDVPVVPALPTVPTVPEVLPTVVDTIAPLAPVVVNLPNNTIIQPVAEFLQSINPPPFPQSSQTAAAAPQADPNPNPLPDVLGTVVNIVAPLFPITVDMPPSPITQPVEYFLASVNPNPFPTNAQANEGPVADANVKIAPIPVNIPLPVGVPINGLIPVTVPFIPLPVEVPGVPLNGLIPVNVLNPILTPTAQITDPIVQPVMSTATNTVQVLSPVGTTFNATLNTASPILVPVFQTEQMLNPLGDSVNSAIITMSPVINIPSEIVGAVDQPLAESIQNTVNGAQPVINLSTAETVGAAPVFAIGSGAVASLGPVTSTVAATLDSLNTPVTGTLASVANPIVGVTVGLAQPNVDAVAGVTNFILPPINTTVAATVAGATPILAAASDFIANNVDPTILVGQQANQQVAVQGARKTFPATPKTYIDEFYAQLKLLHDFFNMVGLKYWLTGGSLLGQYREKRILRWADSNAIGVKAVDGPIIFEKLRAYLKAKMPVYEIWNSVHGLKLINKSMKGVATDIYYYALKDNMYVLSSDRSRKQWPRDMFVAADLYNLQNVYLGNQMVMIPQNPKSYLFSQYGSKFMDFARLNTFNHFANAARLLAVLEVALANIIV